MNLFHYQYREEAAAYGILVGVDLCDEDLKRWWEGFAIYIHLGKHLFVIGKDEYEM